jgi:hypothetical protein
MIRRSIVSLIFSIFALAACESAPGSQVSPVEGEGELELAAVARTSRDPGTSVGVTRPGHAVEAWALVSDASAAGGATEAFGLVTASGALGGHFGLRFGFPEGVPFERAPIRRGEPPTVVDSIVASRACASWKRDACLSVAGTESEGVSFHVKLKDAELPVARVKVVDATRDPLEGIAFPIEGRLVGVQIERNDPTFSRPILLVRSLSGNHIIAGVVEPPFDAAPRTMVLVDGADAIFEHVREAFQRFELSRGAHRSFERELRRELLGRSSASRLPASQWQAYYALSRTESGESLPIYLEPGAHALRRVTIVRVVAEDARAADVIR